MLKKEKSIEDLDVKINQLLSHLNNKTVEVKVVENKIVLKESELKKLEMRLKDSLSIKVKLDLSIKSLTNEVRDLKEEVSKKKSKLKDLSLSVLNKKDDFQKLILNLRQEKDKQISVKKKELELLESSVNNLNESIQKLLLNKSSLSGEIETLKTKLNDYKKVVEDTSLIITKKKKLLELSDLQLINNSEKIQKLKDSEFGIKQSLIAKKEELEALTLSVTEKEVELGEIVNNTISAQTKLEGVKLESISLIEKKEFLEVKERYIRDMYQKANIDI